MTLLTVWEQGLAETYQSLLSRCSENSSRALILGILACLISTAIPLSIARLKVLIRVTNAEIFAHESQFDALISSLSGGIIIEEDGTLRFVHASVKDYLTSPRLPDGTIDQYFVDRTSGHHLIVKSCLVFLIPNGIMWADRFAR